MNQKDYRSFLHSFKTILCKLSDFHGQEHCFFYHDGKDKRRPPYSRINQIIYSSSLCKSSQNCKEQECKWAHNYFQAEFHPLQYKTKNCPLNYACSYQYCPYVHHFDDPRASQFFRFDLNTFKVYPCKKQYSHDRKTCIFFHNYHSFKDKRRPPSVEYQHVQCKIQHCSMRDGCPYAHNKIQQLYHISRYKSKFCQKYLLGKQCEYGEFCSFAHSNEQITIKLIEKMQKNIEFDLYEYKTVWCPLTIDHNRSLCVYAHNIQDFRRSPKEYSYHPQKCPDWKSNENIKSIEEAGCLQGMQCEYCHGWKEYDYHPIIYSKRNLSNNCSRQKVYQTSKESSHEKKDEVFNRKLETISKTGNHKLDHIINRHIKPNVINTKAGLYSNGAPFFIAETSSSYGSKTTKAKSQHYNSSNNQKLSQMEERGSMDSFGFDKKEAQKLECSSLKVNNYFAEDEDYFKYFREAKVGGLYSSGFYPRSDEKKERGSYSCHKKDKNERNYEIIYSSEVNDCIDPIILEKLKSKRISEIKLLNLKEQEIKQLEILTSIQKLKLTKSIEQICKEREQKIIKYSPELQKIFIKHQKGELLKKMRQKRVRQQKLIVLIQKQIQDLSFLTKIQKEQLPRLLQQFKNNYDFNDLRQEIEESVNRGEKEA